MKSTIKSDTGEPHDFNPASDDKIVWCGSCYTVRHGDGLSRKCGNCGSEWKYTSDINLEVLSQEMREHRAAIGEKLAKWKIEIPANVDVALLRANAEPDKIKRFILITAAYTKAESIYYSKWSNGDIQDKKTKMPEEVKQALRDRRKPKVSNPEYVMKLTIRKVKNATPSQLKEMYYQVYGATPGPSITPERMAESIIAAMEELAAKSKPQEDIVSAPNTVRMADLVDAEPAELEQKATVEPVAAPEQKPTAKPRKSKVPLWNDRTLQHEKEAKWSWVVPGSWRPDPEHGMATILDIKCQVCGNIRTIHAPDAFQTTKCVACKKPSKE